MSNSFIQAFAAISMVGVAFILFLAIRGYMATASERRMRKMLERVGIDPIVVAGGDTAQIINEIRQRCRTCSTEAVCERWLAGKRQGGNDFCPNANVFATLRQMPAHQ